MRYRKLSSFRVATDGTFVPEGDYVFGGGRADFWQDQPEAPAQAVATRLRLERGDWFLDLNEGMPWNSEVKGKHTSGTRDLAVRYHIVQTQGVSQIINYFSTLDRDTRQYSVSVAIDTVYGQAKVQGPF